MYLLLMTYVRYQYHYHFVGGGGGRRLFPPLESPSLDGQRQLRRAAPAQVAPQAEARRRRPVPPAIGLTNQRTALAVLPAGPTRAEETRLMPPPLYRRLPPAVPLERPLRAHLVPPARYRTPRRCFAPDVDPWGGGRLPPARLLELGDAGAGRRELASAAHPERVPADPAGDAVNGCRAAPHYGADAVGAERRSAGVAAPT